MAYNVNAYAVDFDALLETRGSKDSRLASRAEKGANEFHENGDVAKAARAWIFGERSKFDAATQAYALEIIVRALGKFLPNDAWSSMKAGWFDTVDEAIERDTPRANKKSAPRLSNYFHAGTPSSMRLRPVDDFPVIGHVPSKDIDTLRSRLESLSLLAFKEGNDTRTSVIEGNSSWHIFGRKSKRSSDERLLIWNDCVVRERSSEASEKEKVHRSRDAAWADAQQRINRWLDAGYSWRLELVSKQLFQKALEELESKTPVGDEPPVDPRISKSVAQFVSWLKMAAKHKRGLLFFYY